MPQPNLSKLIKRQRDAASALDDDLHQIRTRLDELASERTAVENAPLPLDAALARVDEAVDAARNDPATRGGMGRFVDPHATPALDTPETSEKSARKPLTFMAGIMPGTVRESVKDTVRATYNGMDVAPIAPEDRPKKLAALDSERHHLERREETLIREGERAGVVRQRRADADPSIVLLPDSELDVEAGSAAT